MNINKKQTNIDLKVVEDFGKEWQTFNQSPLHERDLQNIFNHYFYVFPFEKINVNTEGFDMGCGSGRWAKIMSPKVGRLNCIDPSSVALEQAKINLKSNTNCYFECASVSDSKIKDSSQDFGYCLGVLHHTPNVIEGIKSCARMLKSGAPFLLYLYYRFDGKPKYFKAIWKLSDLIRQVVCLMPFPVKLVISQIIAFSVYWPLSRIALILKKIEIDVSNIPLSDYSDKPLYVLRNDALDRFGTRLEKRFTKVEIEEMLVEAGFTDIRFSPLTPYWTVITKKI